MRLKKTIIKTLLLSELVIFAYLYWFGDSGINSLTNQQVILKNLNQELINNQQEVDNLEKEIHAWKINDFYKEKVAREQLQMARKGDKLFYIGT